MIWNLIKNGPPRDAGVVVWLVGEMLHWRTQATVALVCAPLFIGLAVLQHSTPFVAILATYAATEICSKWSYIVSPKYELTKNY